MVQVKISYNIYSDAMGIYINDRPIPPVSRLTRFQTMSFGYWCSQVFQAVAEEVNDHFSMIYIGRPCESRILGKYMGDSVCASYTNRLPEIADSALTRLKKLSSLCQSGVTCDRFTAPLHIYTDLPEEQVRSIVQDCTPKLAYCLISAKLHPLREAALHKDAAPAFVLASGEFQPVPCPSGMCVLHVTGEDRFLSNRDNCFAENVTAGVLENRLKEYLELLFFPYVLRKAVQAIRVPESSPLFPSVAVLDKMEPQTLVTLPGSVEFGEVAPIKVRTVPEGATPAKLTYRISDESIVQLSGKGLKGIGTGEAVVEVYITGQASRLCSKKVVSYRRNRIKQLQIKQSDMKICVGDRITLSYTFEPSDADNESSIRLVSSDGTVAAPEHGTTFVARKPGSCRMILQAEQVSASIYITVFPKLEALSLEIPAGKMHLGSITPVKVTRIPDTATLDKLVYTVTPPSLGIYDAGTQSFYAKGSGSGTLTVSNKSGTVKATRDITVKSGGQASGSRGNALLRWLIWIALGLLALSFIAKFL